MPRNVIVAVTLSSLLLLIASPATAQTEPRRGIAWEYSAPGIAALGVGWLGGWLATFGWIQGTTECSSSGWGFFPSCRRTGSGPSDDATWEMAVPLIGPWLSVANGSFRDADVLFPISMGVLQLAGAALFVTGLIVPHFDAEVALGPGSLELRGRF